MTEDMDTKPKKLRWRRGFRRLYLAVAALWLIGWATGYVSTMYDHYRQQQNLKLILVHCTDVAEVTFNKLKSAHRDNVCAVAVDEFRNLFPQYDDLSADELRKRMSQKIGDKPNEAFSEATPNSLPAPPIFSWSELARFAACAFIPVILLGFLGKLLSWVLRGFAQDLK